MSSLDQIAVSVEGMPNREMVHSILVEIAALLERYLQNGERGEIDLQTLPLTPADRTALERALGQGEVHIQLKVMGESEIVETQFPGVWRVTHKDREGRAVASLIEVTAIPAIVMADATEMARSVGLLKTTEVE
ncbi:MAG: hydrogenase expression/formation protein [Gammaproteobacteria bacterium]|jgi:hydrogenase-1 operon protein HyaF|nr:hydrogenase expression/formation protein [Gammaproteobacteria bacterium]MBT4606178.1 hydrogenase expression/formation protein [Thiotrichales bacterium]MBT3472710.1 hydrogenase expression/formation protein [Gammaproteobacteria bacterium]MBT3968007.1 hydrogenase expression/formation protein [Gammaproteobacteria bacterium]MBT4081001.1 hydrogenase expression/formation protein [Gammaproteobacteria bacterium]